MEVNTRTLSNYDNAPLFALKDQDGNLSVLRDMAGSPLVLIFYARDTIPACTEISLAFNDKIADFEESGAKVMAISVDSPQAHTNFAKQHQIKFPLLSDINTEIARQYGICFAQESGDKTDIMYIRTIFLVDPNLRVAKIYVLGEDRPPVEAVLADIKQLFPLQEPQHITVQAPVLLIPRVITPEQCRELINMWEMQGHGDSGFMKPEGNKTVGYIDYSRKIREDHVIEEGSVRDHLDRIMSRRVFPEIAKAFDYNITRREAYKVGCYDSHKGGYFRPHRDNTTGGTRHRKFAMTLNLNADEYDGGYLRFPEYGPHLYKPDTGSAIIFSCSLMHEATDVSSGRRFALLSFLYSDQEAEKRRLYENQAQNDYSQVVRV